MLNNYFCIATIENLELLIKKGYQTDKKEHLIYLINDNKIDYLKIRNNKIITMTKDFLKTIDTIHSEPLSDAIMNSDEFISKELQKKLELEKYENSSKEELIEEIYKLKEGIKSIGEIHRELMSEHNKKYSSLMTQSHINKCGHY